MLTTRLNDHLQRTELLPPKAKIVVAVSGGVDSISLLNLLYELKDFYGWQMVVAHMDHTTRPQSAKDAQFVGSIAQAYDLPFYLQKLGSNTKPSEASWRAKRYGFLERTRDELNYDLIVTAHHGDDRIETAVFNSIRGAERDGITALKSKRGKLVRPLLPFSKAEIITYAGVKNLQYVTDSSNADIGFSRNFVRQELLPLGSTMYRNFRHSFHTVLNELESLNKNIYSQIRSLISELIISSNTESIELSKVEFRKLPDTVATNLLAQLAKEFVPGIGLSSKNLAEGVSFWRTAKTGSTKLLKSGLQLKVGYDTVGVAYQTADESIPLGMNTRLLSETSPYMNSKFKVSFTKTNTNKSDTVQLKNQKLYIRNRLPGDKVHPVGMGGSKKLQDIFVDKKIPREQRDLWPIVVNTKNEVVWVPFIVVSRKHLIDRDGQKITCEKLSV